MGLGRGQSLVALLEREGGGERQREGEDREGEMREGRLVLHPQHIAELTPKDPNGLVY